MGKRAVLLLVLAGCITGQVSLPQETGAMNVLFCDQDDCEEAFLDLVHGAGSLVCAMYSPTDEVAREARTRDGLVVDGSHPFKGAVVEDKKGLMHNKFCVVNETIVWTGSWNPKQGKSIANNVVVLESDSIAAAYSREFDELAAGVFQAGRRGSAQVLLNGNLTEAYFCPEDGCKERILGLLDNAKLSVHVMAYAFTDDDIGRLLEAKARQGLDVRVVFDPRKDKHSEFERLKAHSRITKVHHKVFIVDGKTVITGSMNPTRNGDENNDENVLILRESDVALGFAREFERVWTGTT